MLAVVAPVDHIKVMVPVPPVPLAVAEPSVEHVPLVPVMLATTAVGAVIVAEPVAVQPEASVAVTVYVPAARPVILAVTAPLLHK